MCDRSRSAIEPGPAKQNFLQRRGKAERALPGAVGYSTLFDPTKSPGIYSGCAVVAQSCTHLDKACLESFFRGASFDYRDVVLRQKGVDQVHVFL